jgi:hypothetical protein
MRPSSGPTQPSAFPSSPRAPAPCAHRRRGVRGVFPLYWVRPLLARQLPQGPHQEPLTKSAPSGTGDPTIGVRLCLQLAQRLHDLLRDRRRVRSPSLLKAVHNLRSAMFRANASRRPALLGRLDQRSTRPNSPNLSSARKPGMSLESDLRHTALERARIVKRSTAPRGDAVPVLAKPIRGSDRQAARRAAITSWNIRNVCTFQPSCLIRPRTR